MSKTDLQVKRAVLLSARIRFLPETQPIEESMIDRFIGYGLLLLEEGGRIATRKLEKHFMISFAGGVKTIGRTDIDKSLLRLIDSDRVEVLGKKHR